MLRNKIRTHNSYEEYLWFLGDRYTPKLKRSIYKNCEVITHLKTQSVWRDFEATLKSFEIFYETLILPV